MGFYLRRIADHDEDQAIGLQVLRRRCVEGIGGEGAPAGGEGGVVGIRAAEAGVRDDRAEERATGLEGAGEGADVAFDGAGALGGGDGLGGGERLHVGDDVGDGVAGVIGLDGGEDDQAARAFGLADGGVDAVGPAFVLAQVRVEAREEIVAEDDVGQCQRFLAVGFGVGGGARWDAALHGEDAAGDDDRLRAARAVDQDDARGERGGGLVDRFGRGGGGGAVPVAEAGVQEREELGHGDVTDDGDRGVLRAEPAGVGRGDGLRGFGGDGGGGA